MKIGVVSKRLAMLLVDYGHPLSAFFDSDKLNSILSPEDVYLHNRFLDELNYSDKAPEWLKEIVTEGSSDTYKYVPGAFESMSQSETARFNGCFTTNIVGEDKLLIIMDTWNVLPVTETAPFRDLMTQLINMQGVKSLKLKCLEQYVRCASRKQII